MSDRTFFVMQGFDVPDNRFEEGDIVTEEQIPERSIEWLERDGVIEEIAEEPVNATESAAELAAEHKDFDLAKVKGTGQGGRITKPDVEKALAELEEDNG